MPIFNSKQTQTIEDQKKERYNLEEKIMIYYDLRPAIDFHIFDVPITWQGKEYTIHTFKGGDLNKATLVLFHGYGGSHVDYSKVYKELIKYYRIISIDLPGMGFSSKADIQIETVEEIVTYYTEILELWRIEMNLQNFCLAGHSFGGYIAALYATHYPKYIDQLFLLSPAGSTTYSEEEKLKLQDFSELNFMKQWALNYARKSWGEQTSLQVVGKRWYGNFILKQYLKNGMKFQGTELDLWLEYKKAMVSLPEGSEKTIFILFDFPKVIAKRSIQDLFQQSKEKLEFPITFYFGDVDWMDFVGATRLTETFPQEIQLRKVEKSGHKLTLDNPILLTQYIIEDHSRNKDIIKKLNLKGQSKQEDDVNLSQIKPSLQEKKNLIIQPYNQFQQSL